MPKGVSRADYMRKWRKQKQSEGICHICGSDLDRKSDGSFYCVCADCRKSIRNYGADWRENNPNYNKQYWNENKDQINARRRKAG